MHLWKGGYTVHKWSQLSGRNFRVCIWYNKRKKIVNIDQQKLCC